MGDDENGFALVADFGQQSHHVAGGVNVDVGEGLVEQQNLRIVQQSARQRHPLPHALRILSYWTLEIGIESDGADGVGAAGSVNDAV